MTTDLRRIVLTGVSRGLGLALAARFLERGHTVFGCGSRPAAAEKLVEQYGNRCMVTAVNVADDAAVRAWAETVLAGATPDLLINNAGVMPPRGPLWTVPVEDFDRMVSVNIRGVANVLRHFLPPMVAAKRGVIVNFSSARGRSPAAELAAYCASKYAVEGLTQALAMELPAGMAAVPLNPGLINTAMLRISFGERAAAYPDAETWSAGAADFLLQLGPEHNGQSLTIPASSC